MEKLHSCCGQPSRIAKEQNRTEPTHKELSVVLISDSASFSHTMLHTTSGVPVNLSVLATTRLQCLATRLGCEIVLDISLCTGTLAWQSNSNKYQHTFTIPPRNVNDILTGRKQCTSARMRRAATRN